MSGIHDIKTHIKNVKETAQITKAMEMISVSKLRRATIKFESNQRYYGRVRNTIQSIIKDKGDITHPYLEKRGTQRTAYVVVASDNGMAGEYNQRILRFAERELAAAEGENKLFVVGQMANEYFDAIGLSYDGAFLYCAQDPSLADARRIATQLVSLYDSNEIDEIRFLYTEESEHGKHKPKVLNRRLLPLLKEDFDDILDASDGRAILLFEPSAEEVFNLLVPQYIIGLIYSFLIQAVKCEHGERITSMHNANENAAKMLVGLEREYHRARQAQITNELNEMSASTLRGDDL